MNEFHIKNDQIENWNDLMHACITNCLFIIFSGEFIRDLVAIESGGSGGLVWRFRANATKLVCAVGSVPFLDPIVQTSLVVLAQILQTLPSLPSLSSATRSRIIFPV